MKFEYKIYVVTDTHGNKDAVVVNDSCDTIQICCMENSLMEGLHFESEAYHLSCWCKGEGLELNIIDMEAHV